MAIFSILIDFPKNPYHTNICILMQCFALDFPPRNALGDGPAFWIQGYGLKSGFLGKNVLGLRTFYHDFGRSSKKVGTSEDGNVLRKTEFNNRFSYAYAEKWSFLQLRIM